MLKLFKNKKQNKDTLDIDKLMLALDSLVKFPISDDYSLGYADAIHDAKMAIIKINLGEK